MQEPAKWLFLSGYAVFCRAFIFNEPLTGYNMYSTRL